MANGHLFTSGAIALALVLAAVPLAAQEYEIPNGFTVSNEPQISPNGEWRGLLTVRPEPGPFSDLSVIRLREVTSAVNDPDAWLKDRLTANLGKAKQAESVLDSPDSPFADPSFDALREALPYLFRGLESLSKLPLDFCDGPQAAYNAAGPLRELYCVIQIGPFRQFLVLRLQEAGDHWYYTEIRAMNEKRLRHLIAIANSFHVGP